MNLSYHAYGCLWNPLWTEFNLDTASAKAVSNTNSYTSKDDTNFDLDLNFAVFLLIFIKSYILFFKIVRSNDTFLHYTLWKIEKFLKSLPPPR